MATAIFTRCAGGASGTKLMNSYGWVMRPCSGPESSSGYYAGYLRKHFTANGCKNPYNASEPCVGERHDWEPELGRTHLWRGGDTVNSDELFINTNIGDEDGGKVYLFDEIVKE